VGKNLFDAYVQTAMLNYLKDNITSHILVQVQNVKISKYDGSSVQLDVKRQIRLIWFIGLKS
jgi:hypothetical protein